LTELYCPGLTGLPQAGIRISCKPATEPIDTKNCFTVVPAGKLRVRHRMPGDTMRLPGGTKELKKLFIDQKIPAAERLQIPVIADDIGVIAVYGFGVNKDRLSCDQGAVEICFICDKEKEEDNK